MTKAPRSLKRTDWPDADQAMMEKALKPGGLFEDAGGLAHLRPPTVRILSEAWGRWLRWLELNDPDALAEAPIQRATIQRLRSWMESETAIAPNSKLMFFKGVLAILRDVEPASDWSSHIRLGRSNTLKVGHGSSSRKANRILSSRVLLEAALRHAAPEGLTELTARKRAQRLRDATMIVVLAMMPIRHRSFAGLKLGHSLLDVAGQLTIALPAELTKTGIPWEAAVPEPAASLLRQYLDEVRPLLLAKGAKEHDVVWVNNNGSPMSYSNIGRKVPRLTAALTGVAIPPHFFRDSAATTLARSSSRAAKLITSVLGHTDIKTAERHYIHAGMIEAGRDFAVVLRRLKKGLQ